jgi:hypothetical protein
MTKIRARHAAPDTMALQTTTIPTTAPTVSPFPISSPHIELPTVGEDVSDAQLLQEALEDSPSDVSVLMFGDMSFAPGIAAIVKAIRGLTNVKMLFFIGFEGPTEHMSRFLECLNISLEGVFIRQSKELVPEGELQQARGRLKTSLSNFARFTVLDTFPELVKSPATWVLDPDVLPVADIFVPVEAFIRSGKMLAAARRPDGLTFRMNDGKGPIRSASNVMSKRVQALYKARYKRPFPLGAQPFNAGTYLANFRKWKKNRVALEAEWWYARDKAESLFKIGPRHLQISSNHIDAHPTWGFLHVLYSSELSQSCRMDYVFFCLQDVPKLASAPS